MPGFSWKSDHVRVLSFLALTSTVGFGVGYWLSRPGTSAPTSQKGASTQVAAVAPQSQEQGSRAQASLASAPAIAPPATAKPSNPAWKSLTPAQKELLKDYGLLDRYRDLAPYFPDTKAGQSLRLLAALERVWGNPGDAGQEIIAQMNALRENPDAAAQDLRTALRQLPLGDAESSARQTIIQVVAALDVSPDVRRDLLFDEMKSPAVRQNGVTPQSFYNSEIALQMMMQYEPDPKRLQDMVRSAVEAQPAIDGKRQLLNSYAMQHEDEARNLMTELGIK